MRERERKVERKGWDGEIEKENRGNKYERSGVRACVCVL